MPEKAGKSGRNGADFFLLMPQMRTGPAPVISGAREPICRSHRKKENGKMVPHPRRAEAIKLSTKCRQLEPPKWKLPKKFPFWHRLNVKGGIPSPLHNPPMRVQALPHRFVYSLRSARLAGAPIFFRVEVQLHIELFQFSRYLRIALPAI